MKLTVPKFAEAQGFTKQAIYKRLKQDNLPPELQEPHVYKLGKSTFLDETAQEFLAGSMRHQKPVAVAIADTELQDEISRLKNELLEAQKKIIERDEQLVNAAFQMSELRSALAEQAAKLQLAEQSQAELEKLKAEKEENDRLPFWKKIFK